MTLRQVICSHTVALMTRNLVEPQLQVMAVLIWICNLPVLRVSQSSPLVSNYKTIYELITAEKFDLFWSIRDKSGPLASRSKFWGLKWRKPSHQTSKKKYLKKKQKNKPFMEWNQRTLPIQRKSPKKDCCSFKKTRTLRDKTTYLEGRCKLCSNMTYLNVFEGTFHPTPTNPYQIWAWTCWVSLDLDMVLHKS